MPKDNDGKSLTGLALLGGGLFALSRFVQGGDSGNGDTDDGTDRTVDFSVDVNGRRIVVNAQTSGADVRRYEWGWGDGTGVTTKNPDEPQTAHDYAQGGTYTVTLTVIWQDGTGDSVQKEVTVQRQSPEAAITANTDGLTVTATASSSSDPQGDIAEYSWNWGDGTVDVTTDATAQHTYDVEGTFTISVSVVDAQGNTDLAETTIAVANRPPEAALSVSSSGLEVTATASGSTDPDGNIQRFEWQMGDGTNFFTPAEDPTIQHTYDSGGAYDMCVTVQDHFGQTDTTCRSVNVQEPGTAPSASVELSTGILDNATDIEITASDAETAFENLTGEIRWFVNGTQTEVTGPEPVEDIDDFSMGWTVIGASEGDTIGVEVTVTDTDGRSTIATDSKIAAQPGNDSGGGNEAPTSNFFTDISDGILTIDASASSDPDGSIVSYTYTAKYVSEDGIVSTLTEDETLTSDVKTLEAKGRGDYDVTVTVEDDDGATDTSSDSWFYEGETQSFDHTLEVGPIARNSPISSIPFTMETTGDVQMNPGTLGEDYFNSGGGSVDTALVTGTTYIIDYNGQIESIDWSDTSLVCIKDGQRVDPYSLTPDAGPRKKWTNGSGSEVIEATFRVSAELYNQFGQAPARAAAEWIGGALELRDISHDLLYDFEPIDVPTEKAVCFSSFDTDGTVSDNPCRTDGCNSLDCCTMEQAIPSAHIWWNAIFNDSQGAQNRIDAFNDHYGTNFRAEGEHFTGRKDSNLLLTDANGGGCAFTRGNVGAVGAGLLYQERDYSPEVNDDLYTGGIWTVMHEFGHNMGYSHPRDECGDKVGGSCENGSNTDNLLDGYWYATPCCASQNAAPCTNRCGFLNPKRTDENRMWRPYYTGCTAEIFREHTGSAQGNTAQSYSGTGQLCYHCEGPAELADAEELSLSLSLGEPETKDSDCGCDTVGGTGHSHDTVSF